MSEQVQELINLYGFYLTNINTWLKAWIDACLSVMDDDFIKSVTICLMLQYFSVFPTGVVC
jgi:hypothetical protein